MDSSVQAQLLRSILDERSKQDLKWGEQNHPDPIWMLILSEEVGEVAKALLENKLHECTTELIQTAAVILAWLECQERNADETN